MAINFGDLASFTKGVVDADKAATEARLKDTSWVTSWQTIIYWYED